MNRTNLVLTAFVGILLLFSLYMLYTQVYDKKNDDLFEPFSEDGLIRDEYVDELKSTSKRLNELIDVLIMAYEDNKQNGNQPSVGKTSSMDSSGSLIARTRKNRMLQEMDEKDPTSADTDAGTKASEITIKPDAGKSKDVDDDDDDGDSDSGELDNADMSLNPQEESVVESFESSPYGKESFMGYMLLK